MKPSWSNKPRFLPYATGRLGTPPGDPSRGELPPVSASHRARLVRRRLLCGSSSFTQSGSNRLYGDRREGVRPDAVLVVKIIGTLTPKLTVSYILCSVTRGASEPWSHNCLF